jgi:ATP-dependent RNA helicase DeaD
VGERDADRRPARGAEQWVPFRVSWGEVHGADARRLVAMLCRRGNIRGSDIGAIRVSNTFSSVEVAASVAEAFAQATREPDPRDPRVHVTPFNGDPRADTSPELASRRPHQKPMHAKPVHAKAAHVEPVYPKPAHMKPAHAKPAHMKPAHAKPAHAKPAHAKRAHTKPTHFGHAQSAEGARAFHPAERRGEREAPRKKRAARYIVEAAGPVRKRRKAK